MLNFFRTHYRIKKFNLFVLTNFTDFTISSYQFVQMRPRVLLCWNEMDNPNENSPTVFLLPSIT